MTSCCDCGVEGKPGDLRPYGPGGAPICYDCGMKPENKQQTENGMQTMLDASAAMSPVGVAVIGHANGPEPFVPDDLKESE